MKWKKIGGGTLTLTDGRIIKSGDVFSASSSEVGGFKAFLQPMEEEGFVRRRPAVSSSVPDKNVYRIRQRGTSAWYDVVDTIGTIQNKKALREHHAEELVEQLNKE